MEMKYYNEMPKDEFLSYVTTHSDTPRALFCKEQVAQMLDLAGYPERAREVMRDGDQWYSVDMRDLVAKARNQTA